MSLALIDEAATLLKAAHTAVATAKQQVLSAQQAEQQALKQLATAQQEFHSKIDQVCQDFTSPAASIGQTTVESTGAAPVVSVQEAAGQTS